MARAIASPQCRPSAQAVESIARIWRLARAGVVVFSVTGFPVKHQRGETWVAIGFVCVDPSPRVGRSALRIIGCNKDPRIETRGGASVLSCEAFNGVARLATNKFQSSVCCAKSTSPDPDISPRRVCMLNIWHQIWPVPRRQSALKESNKV
jgi:hypothetical protein